MNAVTAEALVSPLSGVYFELQQLEGIDGEEAQALFQGVLSEDQLVFNRLWSLDKLVNLGLAREVIREDDRYMGDAHKWAAHGLYTDEIKISSQQGADQGASYNNLAHNIAQAEGLASAYFDSEWMEDYDSNQWETGSDRIPFDALWLLDNLADPNVATKYRELSELLAPLRQKVLELSGLDPNVMGRYGMLRHFMGNRAGLRLREMGDYRTPFDEILKSPDKSVPEYLGVLGALYDTSAYYRFPKEFEDGIKLGQRKLIADAAYAIAYHLGHGLQTDVALPLNGQEATGLRLRLDGDEPVFLLDSLLRGLKLIRGPIGLAVVDEALPTVKSEEFGIYRFLRTNRRRNESHMPPVLLHARPRGGVSYDWRYEYGRNGEGVEATFGYIVDPWLEEGRLMEIGKAGKGYSDNRISIRLDREGWATADRHKERVLRDPTQVEGTVSLDVGSVLGRDDWLGVRLGRFLAWGNVLRTEAEGKSTQLNHVTEYFDPSLGNADVFARAVERHLAKIEQRTVDSERLASLFGGQLALKNSLD